MEEKKIKTGEFWEDRKIGSDDFFKNRFIEKRKGKGKEGRKKHISIKEPSPSFGLNANYVYRVFNKSISIKSHYLRASLTFLLRFRTRKSRLQSEFNLSPIIFHAMERGFCFFSSLFHIYIKKKKKGRKTILVAIIL